MRALSSTIKTLYDTDPLLGLVALPSYSTLGAAVRQKQYQKDCTLTRASRSKSC